MQYRRADMCESAGEGLVDLYSAMQPILDRISEERAAAHAAELVSSASGGAAGKDDEDGPQRMKITIIGQPNVVSVSPS